MHAWAKAWSNGSDRPKERRSVEEIKKSSHNMFFTRNSVYYIISLMSAVHAFTIYAVFFTSLHFTIVYLFILCITHREDELFTKEDIQSHILR